MMKAGKARLEELIAANGKEGGVTAFKYGRLVTLLRANLLTCSVPTQGMS